MRFFAAFVLFSALTVTGASPVVPQKLDSHGCTTCNVVVQVAHDLLGSDVLDDCIVDFVVFICRALHIEDHFVCQGMVGQFRDTFIYVIGELVVEPKEICGLLVKGCDGGFDPYNGTWVLDMPGIKPPHKEPPVVPTGKPTLRVLHLSDIHVDNDYLVGSEVKCGEPLCCRPPKDNHEARASAAVTEPAGYWGTVGNCDAPYWLFADMMRNIAANHKDIDYVVVSGDLESHADWAYSMESHQTKVQNVSRTIKQHLPDIPVYFAVGNHEGLPIDNFAPHWTPSKFHLDPLYATMAEEWKDWVPADQLDTVRFNGCYMKQLFPGLRLISLNNGLGDAVNFYLYINQTDPDGTMTWFLEQLEDAERHGDKVQIVAHIPGADSEALEGWAINYYNAVNRFEDIIVAQFFGHTHSEEFYVTYEDPNDATSRPTSVIYSAPSLTPDSEYFPAYRLYTMDGNYAGSSFQLIDFEEFFLNLTEANANPTAPTQWKQLYKSVRSEYGLASLRASEWNQLIDRMLKDDGTFQKYLRNFYRQNGKPCDQDCKLKFLCSARKAHHSDALCKDLEGGLRRTPEATPKVLVHNRSEAVALLRAAAAKGTAKDKCKI